MSRRRFALLVTSVGMAVVVGVLVLTLAGGGRPVGLAEYLGWRDARTPALAAREAQVVQRRIGACMAAVGLPYREFVEPPPVVPDAELGPREWAAKWGFGVSTSVGIPNALPPVADPNLAYIDTLPADEREAYRSALFGATSSPGCNGEVNEAVYGRHDRLLVGLATDLAALEARIARDPRSVDIEGQWMSCMSSPSFRPSSRRQFGGEAIASLTRRLESIMGPPPGRPDVDRAALARLQAFEIDLAIRGIDCDERVRPIDEAVRLEHEGRFVDDHRAALDDIRARAALVDAELGLVPAE